MKTFKYFISESYKLPAIQTVFGSRSIEDTVEEYKDRLHQVEKLILPFLSKLLQTSDQPIIKWPNRNPILEAQIQKILNLTRG
jgi:hypothetical protein